MPDVMSASLTPLEQFARDSGIDVILPGSFPAPDAHGELPFPQSPPVDYGRFIEPAVLRHSPEFGAGGSGICVAEAVDCALSPDPLDRFASARDVKIALTQAAATGPPPGGRSARGMSR
jgi:hypothetical protein